MRIIHGFGNLTPLRNPVVTVGSYDGVHRGHRKLLDHIVALSHESDGESLVITFSPHPREVLEGAGGVELLNTMEEKAVLLERAGIDNLLIAYFTHEFSTVSSHDFIQDYLIGAVGARTFVVGYDHHFGHNKQGNPDCFDQIHKQFGFNIAVMSKQEVDNDKVSSTVIRHFIAQGDMSKASYYLGYPYFIIAPLSDGLICVDNNKLLPPAGSYNVNVDCGGKTYHDTLTISDGRSVSLSCGGGFSDENKVIITFC